MIKFYSTDEKFTALSFVAFFVLSIVFLSVCKVNHTAEVVAFVAWCASIASVGVFGVRNYLN